MDELQYLEASSRFLTPVYHPANVPAAETDRMLDAVEAATAWADRVKKGLVYGRPVELKVARCLSQSSLRYHEDLWPLLHGVLGIFTEAGELMVHLHAVLTGQTSLDAVNVLEELGDIYWYAALLHRFTGTTPSEAWEANIAKLDKRYPQGFNENSAYNRDLPAERQALEAQVKEKQCGEVSD